MHYATTDTDKALGKKNRYFVIIIKTRKFDLLNVVVPHAITTDSVAKT